MNRYGRNGLHRTRAHTPISNSGRPSTPARISDIGTKSRRPPTTACSEAICAPIDSCGQPWRACQITCGTAVSTVSAAPAHSRGRRSRSRGPKTRQLSAIAAQKNGMSHLICRSRAVTTPAASNSQSRRVRTQRTSSQLISTHNTVSTALVVSSAPCSNRNGEQA